MFCKLKWEFLSTIYRTSPSLFLRKVCSYLELVVPERMMDMFFSDFSYADLSRRPSTMEVNRPIS
jgi:hypothetical protein